MGVRTEHHLNLVFGGIEIVKQPLRVQSAASAGYGNKYSQGGWSIKSTMSRKQDPWGLLCRSFSFRNMLMYPSARIIFLGLACVFATASSRALEVGAASCDITPDVTGHKVPLAGYGARKGQPSTGIHDPLHAKVLFLREGKKSMALVTCDLRSVTPLLKLGWAAFSLQKRARPPDS